MNAVTLKAVISKARKEYADNKFKPIFSHVFVFSPKLLEDRTSLPCLQVHFDTYTELKHYCSQNG